MNLGALFSSADMASTLIPEWILLLGIVAMIIVPNLGNATFRLPIPGKAWRIPYFIGGKIQPGKNVVYGRVKKC